MAINVCSIDAVTINGFKCRDKFASLVPILHPPAATSIGGNPRVLRNDVRFEQPEERDDRSLTYEQPIISVTVELFGSSGTETHDIAAAPLDFVTVTNFEVVAEINVNISDLTFE